MIEVRATRAAATLALAIMFAVPGPADAQVGGPFSRLFGAAPERTGTEWTSLDFRAAGGGEYTDFRATDRLRLDGTPATPERRSEGLAGVASATMQFVRHTTVSELIVDGKSIFREYFDQPTQYGATTLIAGMRYRVDPATRVSFDTTASVERQPFFYALPQTFNSGPDWLVEVPATPYAAFMQLNESVYGKSGLEYRPQKHTSVGASVNGRWYRFPHVPQKDFSSLGFEGFVRQKVSRDFGFHFGYGRDVYSNTDDDREFSHEFLDAGVDYGREISIARRTSLRVATMTGMVKEGEDSTRKFRFEGFVSLAKAFNRTWHAEVSVNRRTEFLPGLFAPAFTDSATVSFGGMLAPRLQWAFASNGGRGRIGIETQSTFRAAMAATRVGFALTRKLGTFVQYSYFYYNAAPGSIEVLEQLGKTSRQSVTFGLNVWAPLYDRVKVLRDPE